MMHMPWMIFALPMVTFAFSSIPVNVPFPPQSKNEQGNVLTTDVITTNTETVVSSSPWRIVLDIGREPLSRMPFDWARSGCRMPLVIPCDLTQEQTIISKNDNNDAINSSSIKSLVIPRSETVSFTGPNGAVVRPIIGGDWSLSNNDKEMSFTLTFPEKLQRRDVTIDAGTTIELTGRVYTQAELDSLNEAYYEAREATWQVGGALNNIAKQDGAAKKWNEAKGRWEKTRSDASVFSRIQNQMNYWSAKAEQDKRSRERPDPNVISDRGTIPGIDGGFYIAKGGVVRASKNGPVMGTWQAQPITKLPASYRK